MQVRKNPARGLVNTGQGGKRKPKALATEIGR